MITITDRAITKLRGLNSDDKNLRVAVVGGGCSGLSYKLSWVDAPESNDTVIPFVGFSVVVDTKSKLFISGLELDYTDGLDGQGFQFVNPNAKRSCGCGSSFNV